MTPESNEFDSKSFFEECRDPENWLKVAIGLRDAAADLDWTKRSIDDWHYVPIYRMLIAFSIENLLKGILIVEGCDAIKDDKLSNLLGNHNLRHYADCVSGVIITKPEKCLLDELYEYLTGAGRYPIPKKLASVIRIGHSYAEHSAEIDLVRRLVNYLARQTKVDLGVETPVEGGASG